MHLDDAVPAARGSGVAAAVAKGVPPSFLAARPPAAGASHESSARTWVYRHVSGAIVDGLLWPGVRLPSARELARAWAVARGAVDEALMRLAREGLLERRVGRGSFVARRLPPGMVREVSGRAAITRQAGEALDALAPLLRIGQAPGQGPPEPRPRTAARPMLDPRVPDTDLFPLAAWRRCMKAAHAEADRASLFYGLPAGWPALREATARHLALTRALECSAEQVIILNGPLQALDLVVRVLLEPGDSVVVERPGYMSIARSVGLPVLDLRGAPVDDEGLDVAAARRACPAPSMIYVHPLNQYPTGGRLSPGRRAELLAWARESRAWVIEGDHGGEIVHDGAVPPALMAHRAASSSPDTGQVLFLGTFNSVLFPALRLSYLVVPPRLVPAFTAVRGLFGDHPPVAPQQALARFIEEGHLSAHLRRMRTVYRERRDAVLATVASHLPREVRLGPLLGGTHGCLHLPPGCADEPLVQRLGEDGFGVEMLSAYSWPQPGTNGLVFGYGADDVPRIQAALQTLAARVREALAGPRVPTPGPRAGGPRAAARPVAVRRG